MITNTLTNNGSPCYEHTTDHLLELFSKGGSFKAQAYYYNPVNVLDLFKSAWYTGQHEIAMKLLFWIRDCRGGAGARQNFRTCIKWLADNEPEWVKANIHLIPHYGRWDDLKSLYGTPCEEEALRYWAGALIAEDQSYCGLASKWADRQDYKLRKFMQLSPKAFRKMLVRNTKVVEQKMCANEWNDIEFSKVPSVAMARYQNAFMRRASQEFSVWTNKVLQGEENINTKVLFPHDVIRTIYYTDLVNEDTANLAEVSFRELPNFIEDPNIKIMPLCDFSSSMEARVSGSVSARMVSLALGLYCSSKLSPHNPFYKKLIPFAEISKLESWDNMSLVEACNKIPNEYIGNTDIQAALDLILSSAKMFNVSKQDMINTLLVLSDMQFDASHMGGEETVIDQCLEKWEQAGYDRPRIIYWDLAGYNNSPATAKDKNIAMVSGFSPSILKSALNGKLIKPIDVMMETISKYEVVIPQEIN